MAQYPLKFLAILLIIDFSLGAMIVNYNQQLQFEELDADICEQGQLYSYIGIKWSTLPLNYYIDDSMPDDFVDETIESFEVWNDALGWVFQQTNFYGAAEVLVKYGDPPIDSDLGDVLGVTSSLADPYDPGTTIYSEIVMNSAIDFQNLPFSCELLPFDYSGSFDYVSVLVHEIGHVLGLDHNEDEFTTMFAFYSGTFQKTLSAGDINGVKNLYNI